MSKGKLIIISGPSGVGKDAIIEKLIKKLKAGRIMTTTTRPKRKGEREAYPYYFVSRKEFEKMIERNELFEMAKVYDFYYGSTKKEIEEKLKTTTLNYKKYDWQGAKMIKHRHPEVPVIFIMPESIKDLEKRLRQRGTDSEQVIERRLAEVGKEISDLSFWDYLVVNQQEKLNQAVQKTLEIIQELT